MDQQIRAALSLSDPAIAASCLLHTVKQQPDTETVAWLAELYEELAIENPTRIDALTESLVVLRDSLDIPTILKHDYKGNPYQESFRAVLSLFLYDLLSAAVAGQIFAVVRGIQFPGSDYELYSDPEGWEVSSLGACLQLLISGSVFYNSGHLGRNKEQLLPSIMSLLANETIKDPNGKKLLKVCTAGISVPICLMFYYSLGHD